MLISTEFIQVLRTWSETFMRQSIHDLIRFSKDAGLSMPQVSALFHIHHADECAISNIGVHLGVTNAAASQMIDRLVQQGLIQRTEDPNDRRVKQLKLTDKGASIVQEGIKVRLLWIENLTGALTIEEQESVISALTLLTTAVQELESNHSIDNRHEDINLGQ